MNVTQICTGLLNLNESELETVYQEAVALLKHKAKLRQFEAGKSFKLGDSVYFENSRTGQRVQGKIEKINIKSIKVRTEVGIWNVSPTLLTKVA